jgi:hypothetical protein
MLPTILMRGNSAIGVLALTAVLGVYSLNAEATVGYCAEVQKTADGFLALRESPNASTKALMRLRAGDKIFGPVSSSAGDKLPDWIAVTAVEPYNRDRKKDETIRVSGYVRSRFVKEFTCP